MMNSTLYHSTSKMNELDSLPGLKILPGSPLITAHPITYYRPFLGTTQTHLALYFKSAGPETFNLAQGFLVGRTLPNDDPPGRALIYPFQIRREPTGDLLRLPLCRRELARFDRRLDPARSGPGFACPGAITLYIQEDPWGPFIWDPRRPLSAWATREYLVDETVQSPISLYRWLPSLVMHPDIFGLSPERKQRFRAALALHAIAGVR